MHSDSVLCVVCVASVLFNALTTSLPPSLQDTPLVHLYGWWAGPVITKAAWRFFMMENGALSVPMAGLMSMPEWFAINSATLEKPSLSLEANFHQVS